MKNDSDDVCWEQTQREHCASSDALFTQDASIAGTVSIYIIYTAL